MWLKYIDPQLVAYQFGFNPRARPSYKHLAAIIAPTLQPKTKTNMEFPGVFFCENNPCAKKNSEKVDLLEYPNKEQFYFSWDLTNPVQGQDKTKIPSKGGFWKQNVQGD